MGVQGIGGRGGSKKGQIVAKRAISPSRDLILGSKNDPKAPY